MDSRISQKINFPCIVHLQSNLCMYISTIQNTFILITFPLVHCYTTNVHCLPHQSTATTPVHCYHTSPLLPHQSTATTPVHCYHTHPLLPHQSTATTPVHCYHTSKQKSHQSTATTNMEKTCLTLHSALITAHRYHNAK